MGKRGPKRTPTKLLEERGSMKAVGRKDVEFQPLTETPPAPDDMSTVGRAEWERVAGDLVACGLLSSTDLVPFECYCEAVSDFRAATLDIRKNGLYMVTDKGATVQNPATRIKSDASTRIRQFAAEFGMTPASRSGVVQRADPPKKAGDKPKAKDFIKLPPAREA